MPSLPVAGRRSSAAWRPTIRIGPALRPALAGETTLPRWLVRLVMADLRPPPRRRLFLPNRAKQIELTEREAEILDLMAEDLPTEEIAKRLLVAPVTVRSHIVDPSG